MSYRSWAAVTIAVSLFAVPAQARGAQSAAPAPSVIAVIGEAGLNPAHREFAVRGGAMPALPPHRVIDLPAYDRRAGFPAYAARLQAGVLGRLAPGQLYRVRGTRLLLYVPSGLAAPYDLISGARDSNQTPHRRHGTGAVGAAIGRIHGTSPDSWVVYVPTSDPSGFAWLADQDWIDVASVSSYTVETTGSELGSALPCRAAPHVREFTRDRTFFASSGNSEASSLYLLNAMPEFYLVGGVDGNGSAVMQPRVPASPDAEEVAFAVPYATRTFETGDRYEFLSADFDSIDGTQRFGGTSGAAPSTAGRAASVVREARRLLSDDGRRPPGALAAAPRRAPRPSAGPLADGVFTHVELAAVLHAVAQPRLVGPGRYLVEGYGALSRDSTDRAFAMLRGTSPTPDRSDDDRAHGVSEQARAAAFTARGCG